MTTESEDRIRALGGIGILEERDIAELNRGCALAWRLMRDGKKHTAQEILAATGQSEGLRRLRELRPWLRTMGLSIEKCRERTGSRVFNYWVQKER